MSYPALKILSRGGVQAQNRMIGNDWRESKQAISTLDHAGTAIDRYRRARNLQYPIEWRTDLGNR